MSLMREETLACGSCAELFLARGLPGALLAGQSLRQRAVRHVEVLGRLSTLYLKDQNDKQWANDPAVIAWTAFMKKYYPDGSMIASENFYGWNVAQTLVQVLKQAGNNLSRENVMKQAASLKDFVVPGALPGIKLNTSATDFAPFESVRLARFDGTDWVGFGDVMGK